MQQKNSRPPWWSALLLGSLAVAAAFFIGKNSANVSKPAPAQDYSFRTPHNTYRFINPLLGCEAPNDKKITHYQDIEDRVNGAIADLRQKNLAEEVAVYFRDFKGKWFGVNQDEHFSPASLMKVPLMVAYYKLAENDPSILEKKFTIPKSSPDFNAGELIRAPSRIEPGTPYRVDDLITFMIAYSDNNAMALLLKNVSKDTLHEIYTDLGVTAPEDAKSDDYISAKAYSIFFRILYNATYLNQEYSEKALALLAKSVFHDGLIAGTPQGTEVANKFGEFERQGTDGTIAQHELHDCGIIYKPQSPYLLCVMTKGKDLSGLEQAIQDISSVVYTSFDGASPQ